MDYGPSLFERITEMNTADGTFERRANLHPDRQFEVVHMGILQESDIETARELLGHSSITQTGTYVHTSAERLREAVRKRDKIDYNAELEKILEAVKSGELDQAKFNEQIKKLFRF